MKLGEKQVLTVVKIVDFGVYLGNDEERVLLPKKQVPQGIEVGDPIEVFLYKDSSDRMIATTNEPKLTIGKTAVLEVTDVGRIGAFLDWGLEKELVSDIFYEGNGERCENAFFIGDDFVLKFTSDFDEMQNHINLAKALENVGLLTAVSVKTNSGEEYVFDSGIYFYLTRRIKGKAVTAQSFYTDATTTNEESKVRFIGEILGQLSILLKDVQAKEINLSNDISEWILPKGKELFPEHALFLQKKLNELKGLFNRGDDELPRQIIHRDPNPSNILMTDKQWSILDFDLAERNIRIYDPCYAATAILSESFEASNDQKLQKWCKIYKNILYGYDSVAKLTKTEWKAAPYVVLANQLVCTIWFSQKEQYQELYEINKKMTWWIIEHFDQLRFEED